MLLHDFFWFFDFLGTPEPYLDLITSEHNQKPNFMAMMQALLQPVADQIETTNSMSAAFDLDTAVGAQLDVDGQWIGIGRTLNLPIIGLYFQFDVPGVGWDEGVWWGPGDPLTTSVTLDDFHYRILLYAKAASNEWDGTIPEAYEIWNTLFEPLGFQIRITDNQDMTMGLTLVGHAPDDTTKGLFQGGFLNLKSAGVQVTSYDYLDM